MIQNIESRFIQRIQSLIVLLLMAYDLLTYVPFQSQAVVIKVIYYSFLAILYVLMLLYLSYNRDVTYSWRTPVDMLLLLFMVWYFGRVIVDLYIFDKQQIIFSNNFTVIFFFINATLLPFFALKLTKPDEFDWKKIQSAFVIIGTFALLISLYNVLNFNPDNFTPDGRVNANETLDTIGYGHLAVSVVIVAVSMFINSNKKVTKLVLTFPVLFGVFTTLLAGSRSPLLALLICVIIYIILMRKWNMLIFSAIALLLLFVFMEQIDDYFQDMGVISIERFYNSLFDQKSAAEDLTSERNILYEVGLAKFKENPLLGSGFINFRGVDQPYIHNFILEAFMFTGLIGGIIFIIISVISLINAGRLIRMDKKYLFLSMLFYQYFVFSMFSRSMVILPFFWLTMFMVNNMYYFEKDKL